MQNLLKTTRNIHAVGRNYAAHAAELGNALPQEPLIFAKSPCTLVCGDAICLPASLGNIHHEAELVLRIGQHLPVGSFNNLNCISHVGVGLDFTARSRQEHCKQNGLPWHLAKNFRDGCYVASLSQDFDIHSPFLFKLTVNSELRQDGNSANMLFTYTRVLAFINQTLPLEEGDLIFTGTPHGVGPVVDGDQLNLSCETLGINQQIAVRFS